MLEILAGAPSARWLRLLLLGSAVLAFFMLALGAEIPVIVLVAAGVLAAIGVPLVTAVIAGLTLDEEGSDLYRVESCPACGRVIHVTMRSLGPDPVGAAQRLVEHDAREHPQRRRR